MFLYLLSFKDYLFVCIVSRIHLKPDVHPQKAGCPVFDSCSPAVSPVILHENVPAARHYAEICRHVQQPRPGRLQPIGQRADRDHSHIPYLIVRFGELFPDFLIRKPSYLSGVIASGISVHIVHPFLLVVANITKYILLCIDFVLNIYILS